MLRERPADAIHASPTVAARPASPIRSLAIATIAALFMTFVGALGTGEVSLANRLMYWIVVMITGALVGLGISTAIHQWARLRDRPIGEGALISILIAVPLSVVVVMANMYFLGAPPPGAIEFAAVMGVVLVVSALLTTINYAMARPASPTGFVPDPAASRSIAPNIEMFAEPPALLARLPINLRHARLLALQAEDHYLRVHTDAGSALILLRMSDAVAELSGVEGKRVHRSWWVARAAVVGTASEKGRTSLRLTGELDVPVSRSSRPDLLREGWLE